ncbi:uncharacterized protein LOC117502438 [Thalassophryne amazonica]|uniref:uncharacterized protein LOC117502438 n=1 Tax=Thalassophryne amazonica TaxID=390379 RepID=UPI001471D341|nr:uncharacterized protein LOC117502438 [Thalassophryne amazonica]
MCNYCSKTHSKNATKMQVHLDKCKEYSVASHQSLLLDGSSSASIPIPSSSCLPSATHGGQFLIDSVDQGSHAFADECLARAVYAMSSPLTLTENIYWKRFFSVLRPAYCPPTREALSSHLLECEYDRVQIQVQEAIRKADCVTIICSGGSNIRESGPLVSVVATPLLLFYKTTQAGKHTCRSVCIADELTGIINEVRPKKVFAVVTDNMPEMTAAWAQIEETLPHVSAIGCAASMLKQLHEDVLSQPSIKALSSRAEQVVRCVREKKILAEIFRRWQMTAIQTHTSTFTVPAAAADWTGVVNMFSCLLEDQNSLQEMASSCSLDVEASMRATIHRCSVLDRIKQRSKPALFDWELH